jgi:hypothetical protein
LRATDASRACENSRPIADPICATSLAGPSRSRRAISEACKLAGTAKAGDGTAAAVRRAAPSLSASSTAFVISCGASSMGARPRSNSRSRVMLIKWFDQQMTGLSTRLLKPGEVGSMRESTRECDVFRTLYADMDRVGTIACIPGERPRPPTRERIIVNGPIKSRGTAATQRQLDCFKAAIARSSVALDEAFVPALAPGWLDHFIYNEHYGTDEEFVYALADAMRDKYRAIVEAGFILQIDDPGIATSWDMIKPEPSLADYRKYVMLRIEALNHALEGIPPEKVRLKLAS